MSRNGVRVLALVVALLVATGSLAAQAPEAAEQAPQLEKAKVKIALKQYDQARKMLRQLGDASRRGGPMGKIPFMP